MPLIQLIKFNSFEFNSQSLSNNKYDPADLDDGSFCHILM